MMDNSDDRQNFEPYAKYTKHFTAAQNSIEKSIKLSFLYVCMVNTIYLLSFVETPRKFIIAELTDRKLCNNKFTWCFHKA